MPEVALTLEKPTFRRPLGRLEELDALLLTDVLMARLSGAGKSATLKILAAAKRNPDQGETSEEVVLNWDELKVVDIACKSVYLQTPAFKSLCDEVAKALVGL